MRAISNTQVRWLLGLTIVALLTVARLHLVWERDATQLIWSQQEAYLVAARLREGWSGNLWEAAWQIGRAYVGGLSGDISDRRRWLEVTKITRTGTTLTVVPDTDSSSFLVFEGHVYGRHNEAFEKWVDGKFVPIDPEERSRFGRGYKGGHFRDVSGWSSEINLLNTTQEGERRYPLVLDGVPVEVLVNQGTERRTVSVQFPSRAPAPILDLPNQTVWVAAATYRRLLSQPPSAPQ